MIKVYPRESLADAALVKGYKRSAFQLLGDENGVMVVPRDQINELQRVAAGKEARDPATRARLDQGEALKDLSGAARFAHYIDHPYGKV